MASETKRKHDEDPYELLGLTSGCDEKAIEKGYFLFETNIGYNFFPTIILCFLLTFCAYLKKYLL